MARKEQDLEERVKTQAAQMLSQDERMQSLEQLVTILEEQKDKMSLQRQEELETAGPGDGALPRGLRSAVGGRAQGARGLEQLRG